MTTIFLNNCPEKKKKKDIEFMSFGFGTPGANVKQV